MQQKDYAYQSDDQALLDERALQRIDGAVDQSRTVIDRLHADALGQARRHLGQAPLYVVDHRQRIFAEALKRDAGDNLAFPVHFGDAAAFVRSQLDTRDIFQLNRDAALVLDHDLFEIGQALEVAAPAHRELGFRHFHRAAAHIHVALADHVADSR